LNGIVNRIEGEYVWVDVGGGSVLLTTSDFLALHVRPKLGMSVRVIIGDIHPYLVVNKQPNPNWRSDGL